MLEEYRQYLLNIRNSLIQCGVEFPEGATDSETYESVFYLGLKLSDILYFYRVLAVSGSEYALKDFIFPLSKTYKDVIRAIAYAEFDEYILPDYKKLIGDDEDELELDDDEDYYSEDYSDLEDVPEKEPDEVVATDVEDEDLFTSMFGEAESDDDSAFLDESIEDRLDREFKSADTGDFYNIPDMNTPYSTSKGIPAPVIPEDSEEYEFVSTGVILEDYDPTEESSTIDISPSTNETGDIEYVDSGIFLEDFESVYNNDNTVQDISSQLDDYDDTEGYYEDEDEEYSEDEEYYDDTEGYAEEDEEEYSEDEEYYDDTEGYAEEDEEEYYDDTEGYAEEEDEYYDDTEGYAEEDDYQEDEYTDVTEDTTGKDKNIGDSASSSTKKKMLSRLKEDDLGIVAQDVASKAVTKIRDGVMSLLNGKNSKED